MFFSCCRTTTSSPSLLLANQRAKEGEEEEDEHRELRKLFSRDANPISTSTKPPAFERLFSREALGSMSSPITLNRLFSRGAIDSPRLSNLVSIQPPPQRHHALTTDDDDNEGEEEVVELEVSPLLKRKEFSNPLTVVFDLDKKKKKDETVNTKYCYGVVLQLSPLVDLSSLSLPVELDLSLYLHLEEDGEEEEEWTLMVPNSGGRVVCTPSPLPWNVQRIYLHSRLKQIQVQERAANELIWMVKSSNNEVPFASQEESTGWELMGGFRFSLLYRVWSIPRHVQYPLEFQSSVKALLLVNVVKWKFPSSVLFRLFELLPPNWFHVDTMEEDDDAL